MTRRGLIVAGLAGALLAGTPAAAAPEAPAILYQGFRAPVGMGLDSQGNVYVANWSAGTITRIAPDGTQAEWARGLDSPSGLAVDRNDAVYVASYSGDRVERVTQNGQRSVFVDGLSTPAGLAFDQSGNLLVANRARGEVLAFTPDGRTRRRIAEGLPTPVGVAQAPDGAYWVSNLNGGVVRIGTDGHPEVLSTALANPAVGLVLDGSDAVFVADYGGTTVRRVDRRGHTVVVADGLRSPVGLLRDGQGRLLAATWGDGAVYHIKG